MRKLHYRCDSKEAKYLIEKDLILEHLFSKREEIIVTINDDYFVFGKQVIVPCDAIIVEVITGVKDYIPGELNPKQLTGNTVVLKTANAEFLLFAHFKEKSIQVKVGQQVKAGDLLGLCGNSGNSSEPHLHLSLQNVKNMMEAQGGKLFFDNIKVNGEIKQDYLPIKNDKIQNIKR